MPKITVNELERIRDVHAGRTERPSQIIATIFDVEIRRRNCAGAKPKHSLDSAKERNSAAAKAYRERKRLKKLLAATRKYDKRMKAHKEKYGG